MSLIGNNWLPEGYYEDDGYGYTKVDDPDRVRELLNEGKLYEHDGMGLTKIEDKEHIITIKKDI